MSDDYFGDRARLDREHEKQVQAHNQKAANDMMDSVVGGIGSAVTGFLNNAADKEGARQARISSRRNKEIRLNKVVDAYCAGDWDRVIEEISRVQLHIDRRYHFLVAIAYAKKNNLKKALKWLPDESFFLKEAEDPLYTEYESFHPQNYSEKTLQILSDTKLFEFATEEVKKAFSFTTDDELLQMRISVEEENIRKTFEEKKALLIGYWNKLSGREMTESDMQRIANGNQKLLKSLQKEVKYRRDKKPGKDYSKVFLIILAVVAIIIAIVHFTRSTGFSISLPSFGGNSSTGQTANVTATANVNMELYSTAHNNPLNWIKTINAGETVNLTGKTDGNWTQIRHGN
jgi:hypothetical protein